MNADTRSQVGSEDTVEIERHEGVKDPSAVYSVRFSRDELRRIRSAARKAGLSTSEWIRQAAAEKACSAAPEEARSTS